jgi:hypothetical protein
MISIQAPHLSRGADYDSCQSVEKEVINEHTNPFYFNKRNHAYLWSLNNQTICRICNVVLTAHNIHRSNISTDHSVTTSFNHNNAAYLNSCKHALDSPGSEVITTLGTKKKPCTTQTMEPCQHELFFFPTIHLLASGGVVHLLDYFGLGGKSPDPASHLVASNPSAFLTVRPSEILNVGKIGRFWHSPAFSLGNAGNQERNGMIPLTSWRPMMERWRAVDDKTQHSQFLHMHGLIICIFLNKENLNF